MVRYPQQQAKICRKSIATILSAAMPTTFLGIRGTNQEPVVSGSNQIFTIKI